MEERMKEGEELEKSLDEESFLAILEHSISLHFKKRVAIHSTK